MSYYPPANQTFNKRNAQILHAIKRARQRYGLELTIADVERIARTIRKEPTRRIKVVSHTRVIHELTYSGKVVWVLYDKKRHTLITFLPKE